MRQLPDDRVGLLRLRAQRLSQEQFQADDDVLQVVKALCGIQAQDMAAASLAVRARSRGLVAADVDRARREQRLVIRTWCMRGTLHLLSVEDLVWLLPLLGPIFIRGDRRRREELGLDEESCARGIRAMRDLLAEHGALTRAELVEQLAARGIMLLGQAAPHLIARAALEGIVCHGPDRGAQPTYVLLDQWAGLRGIRSLPAESAGAELARRYLAAYGPARPEDFAAWSGLPLGSARSFWHELEGELMAVEAAGQRFWMAKTSATWLDDEMPAAPIVRLLPAYDTYLLGYRDRSLVVEPHFARRINAGGGVVHPALLVGSRVAGTWKAHRRTRNMEVRVEPFLPLAHEAAGPLEAEVADLGRFQGMAASLQLGEPPA